jgi:hypothetical protein
MAHDRSAEHEIAGPEECDEREQQPWPVEKRFQGIILPVGTAPVASS